MGLEMLLKIPVLIVLTGGILFTLLLSILKRNLFLPWISSTVTLFTGIVFLLINLFSAETNSSLLFSADNLGRFYALMILGSGVAATLLSYGYIKNREENYPEYFVLLLLAVLGSTVMAFSINFLSFFIGLEILSVATYALASFLRKSIISTEAGVKYLVLAGLSGAVLAFGISLIFFETGDLTFVSLKTIQPDAISGSYIFFAGAGLLVAGVAFKLAMIPFHFWSPDVYQGSPAPVTGFISTGSKVAVFVVLIRIMFEIGEEGSTLIRKLLTYLAILSMIGGNILALLQKNIKRLLAYSGIAHLGYAITALIAFETAGGEAATFYLLAYTLTVITAFGIITYFSAHRDEELQNISDYNGMFWSQPLPAIFFAVALFSLAGMPLTGGFIGKYYILKAGTFSGLWPLIGALVLGSVIGIFYYLRVMVSLFAKPPEEADKALIPSGWFSIIVLLLLVTGIAILGIFPNGVLEFLAGVVFPG